MCNLSTSIGNECRAVQCCGVFKLVSLILQTNEAVGPAAVIRREHMGVWCIRLYVSSHVGSRRLCRLLPSLETTTVSPPTHSITQHMSWYADCALKPTADNTALPVVRTLLSAAAAQESGT